jgi:hypothetical protein
VYDGPLSTSAWTRSPPVAVVEIPAYSLAKGGIEIAVRPPAKLGLDQRLGLILELQPMPHVLPFSVDWQALAAQGADNDERN